MMKKITIIAGALLGLLFLVFGLNHFIGFIKMPPPPAGSPMANFMGAMYKSGYLDFVKILEITGAILVAIPKTRNFGLLILTPIIVNILAIHVFLMGGAGLFDPPVIMITLLCGFLLYSSRETIGKLVN